MQSTAARQQSPRNITESYNPRYRKGEFGHLLMSKRNRSQPPEVLHQGKPLLQEGITGTFGQLQGYINGLETLFSTRMEVHEEEIIQIAHSQIKKIQAEAEGIIRKYSQLIKERNISNQLLDLKYEVRYYQLRACEMFEENKKLKAQIRTLRDEIDGLKMGQESAHSALTNVSKKYLREKTIRKKLEHTQLKPLPELLSNSKLSQLIKQNPEDGSKLGSTTTPHRQKPLSQTKPHLNFFSENLKNRQSSVVKVRFVREERKQRLKTEPARELFPLI